jgi:hypothetical protein
MYVLNRFSTPSIRAASLPSSCDNACCSSGSTSPAYHPSLKTLPAFPQERFAPELLLASSLATRSDRLSIFKSIALSAAAWVRWCASDDDAHLRNSVSNEVSTVRICSVIRSLSTPRCTRICSVIQSLSTRNCSVIQPLSSSVKLVSTPFRLWHDSGDPTNSEFSAVYPRRNPRPADDIK